MGFPKIVFVLLLTTLRWSAEATATTNTTSNVDVIADNQSSLSPIANATMEPRVMTTTLSGPTTTTTHAEKGGATSADVGRAAPTRTRATDAPPVTARVTQTSDLSDSVTTPSTPTTLVVVSTVPSLLSTSSKVDTSTVTPVPPSGTPMSSAVPTIPVATTVAPSASQLNFSTSSGTNPPPSPSTSTSGESFSATTLLIPTISGSIVSGHEQLTHNVKSTSTANPPLTGSPVSRTTEAPETRDNDTTGSVPPPLRTTAPPLRGRHDAEHRSSPDVTSPGWTSTTIPPTTTTLNTTTLSPDVVAAVSQITTNATATFRSSTSSPPGESFTIDDIVASTDRLATTARPLPPPPPPPRIHSRKKVMNAEMLGVSAADARKLGRGDRGEAEASSHSEEVEDVEGVSFDEGMLIGGSEEEALSSDGGEESVLVGAGAPDGQGGAAAGGGQSTPPSNHPLYFDFRRQCPEEHAGEVWWNRTYGGVIAVRLCPDGYTGKVYRMCYYGGSWGDVDFSECRVQQLIKLKHLLYYHVHKNLTDGFHSLSDELLNSLQRYRLRSVDDYLESLDSLNIIINARVTLDFDVGQDIKYLKTILKISDILFSKFDNKWSFPQEQQDMVTMKMVQILHGMTHFANLVAEGVKRSSRSIVVFNDFPHIGLEARVIRFDQDYKITLPNSGGSILLPAGLYKVIGSNDKYVVVTTWYNGIAQSLHEEEGSVNSAIFATTIHPGHDTHFMSGPVTLTLSTTDKVEDDFYAECSYLRRAYNKSSLWSHVGCSQTAVHPNSVTCVCHHMANIAVIVRKQHHEGHVVWKPVSLIVIIGCAISLAALLSTFVAHVHVLRYDSSESSMILLNLLLAMTAAQIVFMGGIQATSSREVCEGVSIVLHYLYLVSSFWLLSHGIHVFLRTRSSKESPCSSHMRDYCLLSWVAPVVLVVVTFAVNPRGYEIKKYCWLSIEKGMLLSYIVPIFSLIMVNTTLMILVLKHLFETQPFMKKSEIDKARTSVRAGVILLPFFGVNWFLGVLAMEDRSTEIFETIFAISTSLQGFLIFLFYSLLHTEVRKAFRQFTSRILRRRKSSDLRLRRNRRRQAALDAEPLLVASDMQEQAACGSSSGNNTSSIVAQCLPPPEEPFVLAEEDQAIARADIT